MPQPALHVILAKRILRRWHDRPDIAPISPGAPAVEAHFLHGALAPDTGLFPGCDALVSRLVHADGSGRVARALLALARTDAEAAFAWGWVTHVLADARIHPLVNQAAMELATIGPGRRCTRTELSQAHTRVEIGLDAHFFGAEPSLSRTRLKHAFSVSRIDFVCRALQLVYGIPFDRSKLLRAHRNVTRCFNAYLKLTSLIGVELGTVPGSGSRLQMKQLRWIGSLMLDRSSVAWGFLNAARADEDFVNEIQTAIAGFHEEFETHVGSGMRDLPDYDLETGRVHLTRVLVGPMSAGVPNELETASTHAALPGAAA